MRASLYGGNNEENDGKPEKDEDPFSDQVHQPEEQQALDKTKQLFRQSTKELRLSIMAGFNTIDLDSDASDTSMY